MTDTPNEKNMPSDGGGDLHSNPEQQTMARQPGGEDAASRAQSRNAVQNETYSTPQYIPPRAVSWDDKEGGDGADKDVEAGTNGGNERGLRNSVSRAFSNGLSRLSKSSSRSSGENGSQRVSGDTLQESEELDRVVSQMFGKERQKQSKGYQTTHRGVIWKDLKVQGSGMGVTYQTTDTDYLLMIPRYLWKLLTFWRWRREIKAKSQPVTILHNFSGCVRPREMMLVLGRPGSGCSTLLKVLGNQRAGYDNIEGSVTYGGTDASEMAKHYSSEVIYTPEEDFHYAALTVRQTLNFAISTRTPSRESRLDGESRDQYRKTYLDSVSKVFWIQGVLDTMVGNDIIKGISGGEKRRVSLAEAMVTKASTQCWDNSTRGLDASTALEYVSGLRSMANIASNATIVALYQASENLYKRFDKVLVIVEGRCAYFGKAQEAREYFESLGFECPTRQTTADFISSVSDEYARQIKPGWEDRIPRSAEDFERAYNNSSAKKKAMRDLETFEDELNSEREQNRARDEEAKKQRKNFMLPIWKQALLLTRHQFLLMFGDRYTLLGKWAIVLFLAFIVGSLFYDLPKNTNGLFTRGGVLFYIILFNSLLAMAELSGLFDRRPVIYKHRALSMYRPAAFALAQVLADVPQLLIQVAIFDIVVYFLSNLARTASQFFICYLFTFLITMTMYSFFRAIGAISASLDVATRMTGLCLQFLVVYTGYFLPPTHMRPWLHWFMWLNPIQYTFEALIANEFYDQEFTCTSDTIGPQGPRASQPYQACLVQGSEPGRLSVNGARYIKSNFTYTRHHLWRNFGVVIAWFILYVLITMAGMEMQKGQQSGKSMTVYRREEAPKDVKRALAGKDTKKPSDEEKHDEKESNMRSSSSGDESAAGEDNQAGANNGADDMGISTTGATFTWQHVNFSVPSGGGQKQLLQDVQGYVRPGRLTCMIGASGAGKTTLLNALAQRLTVGSLSGEFLVNGKKLPKSFARNTGYAQQADIHESALTVRESLRFSAYLRRPRDVPLKEKYDYCEKVIDLLELRPIAGAVVGTEGSGLDAEQRKRVTIAVELAAKPELLLFLDEPTSGLDSLAAFNLVRLLRKLTDSGQAVLATIHQPSAVLFEQFDELILLQAGGRVVYHGELGKDSRTLIDYFEKNGGKKCPPNANPAEYMLEVIGAGDPNYNGKDWGDVWANSEECKSRTREIESIVQEKGKEEESQEKLSDTEYAMPIWDQVMAVTRRAFIADWRTPDYALGKFLLQIFCGLFNTFTFWHINHATIDFQQRLFSVFLLIIIAPPLIQQLQPRFLHFRHLFEARESQAKVYSWVAVIFAAVVTELPYAMVSGTIYFCCWYFGAFFWPRDSFSVGFTWMITMLFSCWYSSFGQMLAAWAPNELFASLLVPALITFPISFAGVVVPYRLMPSFWRWWMYWLSPMHYVLEGILGAITNKVQVKCNDEELTRFRAPSGMSCKDYAGQFAQQSGGYLGPMKDGYCTMCQYRNGNQWAETFNVKWTNHWRDFFVLLGFVCFNIVMVFIISWLYLIGVPRATTAIKMRKLKSKGEGQGQQQQGAEQGEEQGEE